MENSNTNIVTLYAEHFNQKYIDQYVFALGQKQKKQPLNVCGRSFSGFYYYHIFIQEKNEKDHSVRL